MKTLLLKLLKGFITQKLLEVFKKLEDEAALTTNEFDDKSIIWVKIRVMAWVASL